MVFTIGSPLTITGNKGKDLLAEYNAYKLANPDTTKTYQDYVLMKEASGGLDTTLTSTIKPTIQTDVAYAGGVTAPVGGVNGDVVVTPSEESMLNNLFRSDLETLERNRKYLIGNTIGQSILNMSNLSNAFAARPTSVGIGRISNVEYPNITGARLAELQGAVGRYRGGVGLLAGQKGLSPEVRIGAEADVLANELVQRGTIADAQNTNKIAEITANAAINQSNIENAYASKLAAQTRLDEIEAFRSERLKLGLTTAGKIGAKFSEKMIELGNQKTQLGATNYYLGLYQNAVAKGEFEGSYTDYLKTIEDAYSNLYIGTSSSATNKELLPIIK